MSYDPSVIREANDIISARRERAMMESTDRKRAAYEKVPALKDIESELFSLIRTGSADREKITALLSRKNSLLRAAGIDPESLGVKYFCGECRDTGYIGERMCGCRRKLLNGLTYDRSPLAKAFPDASIDDFDILLYPEAERENMQDVKDFLRGYADSFTPSSGSLFFTGPPGVGKTFMSAIIARRAIERGFSVIYETAPHIIAEMEGAKFAYGQDRADAQDRISRFFDCDLLIIDDLGTEMSTPFSVSAVHEIINSRSLGAKPIIFSSNLSIRDLGEIYPPRLISRIVGDFVCVTFTGDDIRLVKKGRAAKNG